MYYSHSTIRIFYPSAVYVGIIQEDAKYMASVVVVGLATVKVLPCKSRTTVFQNRCDDCVRPQPTYLTIGRCTAPQFPSLLWTIGCSRNTKYICIRTLIPAYIKESVTLF